MHDEMVPQRGQCVQAGEREEDVRQITVYILCGLKYRSVLFDSKVKIHHAKMKYSAVINESYETDDGYHEEQPIKRPVHRTGKAARDGAKTWRQGRRRMLKTVA